MKFQYIKDKVSAYFTKGNERSVAVKKNIAVSLVLKCISILVSLQVVPLTIGYVNPTKYGIWLTLSSIIAWLSYFDLGFAHGFRNRFAEAKAKGDMKLAKEYVSTTYAVLFLLFSVILLITLVVNNYLDWSRILNIDPVYEDELSLVFGLLACFFCLNIVASVFTTMLTADQKPALASLISTSGQVLAFACVYVLTKTTKGSLSALAVSFSAIPCLFLLIVSIIVYQTKKYKIVAPSLRDVRFSLVRSVVGLGGQFFVVMFSMLFIFQLTNIILSRVQGPEAVTQYNIAYKYFNVLNMAANIILTPFCYGFKLSASLFSLDLFASFLPLHLCHHRLQFHKFIQHISTILINTTDGIKLAYKSLNSLPHTATCYTKAFHLLFIRKCFAAFLRHIKSFHGLQICFTFNYRFYKFIRWFIRQLYYLQLIDIIVNFFYNHICFFV